MEHDYDVTFLSDAIGAENLMAWEASVRVNYPMVANAVLGLLFERDTSLPLDAVVKVADGRVLVHVPRIVVGKMPWDTPPSHGDRQRKLGPTRDSVDKLYGSCSPSVSERV